MNTGGTQQWDQFSLSSSAKVDTFGFSHLAAGVNISRSPTPVGASNMMIRSDSRHSKSDSPFISSRTESPRPTSPLTPTSASSSPVNYRPNARQSVQSYTGAVAFIDEPSSVELQGGSDQTLFGIPFDSLVKLASPNELYGLVTTRDPEVATLYSAASVLSVPAPSRPLPHPPAGPSSSAFSQALARSGSNIASQQHSAINRAASVASVGYGLLAGADPVPSAQMNYESRELAVDATPLRSAPDEVLRGSHGLVRGVLLNDRVHALTVDTAGEVALWDLIRGVCRGYFSSSDVDEASRASSGAGVSISSNESSVEWSPREALETVRECIEGEAMIASWGTVETKMGSLTVHLMESTCFDAEVYADEAGFADTSAFPEEHRSALLKFILIIGLILPLITLISKCWQMDVV
jgi:WD repeat-containing protein 48